MITLREAKTEDINFIYKTKKEALFKHVDAIWGWIETDQQERFYEALNLSLIKIILLEQIEVGFIELIEYESNIELINIHIEPSSRGNGIGSFVINQLVWSAKEQKKRVELRVFKSNLRAINLYEKLGFVRVKSSQNHHYYQTT